MNKILADATLPDGRPSANLTPDSEGDALPIIVAVSVIVIIVVVVVSIIIAKIVSNKNGKKHS